jgi:hypothetical protein
MRLYYHIYSIKRNLSGIILDNFPAIEGNMQPIPVLFKATETVLTELFKEILKLNLVTEYEHFDYLNARNSWKAKLTILWRKHENASNKRENLDCARFFAIYLFADFVFA